MAQALSGVRVLDLSQVIAGPYCTRILAGFGADVIKVERPGGGDPARGMGPFLDDKPGPGRSGLFCYLNANKRGITLDLKRDADRHVFKDLVEDADVVIESFRPGVMERLGVGYAALREVNPGIVMTSISNFGQSGPYRDYQGSHLIFWSMSGGRYADGEQGQMPVQVGGWITHYCGALHALVGTTTALYRRNITGVGQHVDTSILESTMLATCYPHILYSYTGTVHHAVARAYLGIFECKDGYIAPMVLTNQQWELLCAFFEMPELIERVSDLAGLIANYDELRALFAPRIKNREKMELFQSGTEWRIPFALVPDTNEILQSPQHLARQFFERIEDPILGTVTMPGAPYKLSDTPWQLRRPAPGVGEHNDEVLGDRPKRSEPAPGALREGGAI